jgi:peroxiredoxin
MNELTLFNPAPDFAHADIEGKTIRLSEFRGRRCVVLVFNRGFR